jgi:hypothetical protein
MNIEILNWLETPWVVNWGAVKRTRRGESTGAIIHVCLEKYKENRWVAICISN